MATFIYLDNKKLLYLSEYVYKKSKINNQLSLWLITMFWIISIMIIVGGLTRLTDSGLSITKWELFSGFFPPSKQE